MAKSIYEVMLQFVVVEKAWRQELELAGYKDIHSIRKQKKINTDTQFTFFFLYVPGS